MHLSCVNGHYAAAVWCHPFCRPLCIALNEVVTQHNQCEDQKDLAQAHELSKVWLSRVCFGLQRARSMEGQCQLAAQPQW